MAIAFRSVGTRLKVDVTAGGSPQNVPMPVGHTGGDALLLVVLMDCNNAETGPAGWSFLGRANTSGRSAAHPSPQMALYWKVDSGSEPANASVGFSTTAYPAGNPYVIACILAWSGTHPTNPVGEWGVSTDSTTAVSENHPQITTADANDWLVTVRGASSDSHACTFTETTPGTDSERVDDSDGFNELALAVYDSNAALAAGLQTQRVTLAARDGTGVVTYGSTMFSLALRSPATAGATNALPGTATASGAAYDATVTTTVGPWSVCSVGAPAYTTLVDWAADGNFAGAGDDITADDLQVGITIKYGRDQGRQHSPTSAGVMALSVNNSSRKYSPENAGSVLVGNLDPARDAKAQVVFGGTTYPLFRGKIDDFQVHADRGDRTVDFTFLDGLALLQGVKPSTPLYTAVRSGDAVNKVLDAAGWTGPRDIDAGASFFPYWWLDGNTDTFTAVQDIVRSEGPPAIAYQAPDGTFIFRDRHHRLIRSASVHSQGVFASKQIDCAVPAVTGLHFTDPFVYTNGWRDIVNSVSFSVSQRLPGSELTPVWTSTDTTSLSSGQSVVLDVSAADPFYGAVVPDQGTDFTASGAGTAVVSLSRTSGQSVQITIMAAGGPVTISGLQLRAFSVPVARITNITYSDSQSIKEHGERVYPDTVPWANANDAYSIASLLVARYAERRPIVQLQIVSEDPTHWMQVVTRTVGDRITINHGELGMASDFFVERVEHTISRIYHDRPPVHSVVLGCEKQLGDAPANPFTFDVKGAGFDQGVFDPPASDQSGSIWIWDDPVQGVFDTGLFAT